MLSHLAELIRATGDFGCFMHIARYQVPKFISAIRKKPSATSYSLLQGYVSGYLAMLSGHRPVVFCNMRKADLKEAETDEQQRTMVWVNKHKTDRSYGHAFLALLRQEADWLNALVELSAALGWGDCPYVMQWKGRQVRGLNSMLRQAWRHAGMPGDITFGLIRASVATQVRKHMCPIHVFTLNAVFVSLSQCFYPLFQAKEHLSQEERRIVCDSMCHDVTTADRFYTAMPELQDAFSIREMRMKALEGASQSPDQNTTSDESLESDLSEEERSPSGTTSDTD